MEFNRIVESVVSEEEKFNEFLEKRSTGAAKLAQSAKEKGGYSILTAIHFAAKAKPMQSLKNGLIEKIKKNILNQELKKFMIN
jgi:hypothetical protein